MSDAFERAADRAEATRRELRHERSARGRRKGFQIHAAVFVAIQLLLVVIWTVEWQSGGSGNPWFLYALAGWGAGLAAHYAAIR